MSTRTNSSLRGTLRCVLLSIVVMFVLSAGAAGAVAQVEENDNARPDRTALAVSLDGTTWTQSISQPLFDPEVRWVPGDVRTSQFYVRNTKPEEGALSLVIERPVQEALLDSGFLTIAARAGDGPWMEVASGGRSELIDSEKVGSKDEVAVELRASLDSDAPNMTMVLATDLELTLILTQAGVVADATSTDDPHDPNRPGNPNGPGTPDSSGNPNTSSATADGVLPDTGSPIRPWVLPLALLLLGAGAVLIARRGEEEGTRRTSADLDVTL